VDIIFLRHLLSHIGLYSGYENFIKKLKDQNLRYAEVYRKRSLQRFDLYGRFHITTYNKKKAKRVGEFYNVFSYLAEMEALKAVKNTKSKIVHNTFTEDNHGYLGQYKKKYKFALIATAHQPVSWWKYTGRNMDYMKQLTLLLALTEHDKEYFEKHMPGRTRLVHHGVDTEFFKIQNEIQNRSYRLLFVGNWLRDINFFELVVSRILNVSKDIMVDIVSPQPNDLINPLFKLCRHAQVTVHRNLNDQRLLDLYNDSRMLFLPLIDSTANNSLLEAAACGVPVVTTDLPGVQEYSHNSFAFYYNNQRDCVDYILETIKEDALLKEQSCSARNCMVSNFSLDKIALEHANIYREFL
jgi:glycosyltransferase involved in cell wall biosynthesis